MRNGQPVVLRCSILATTIMLNVLSTTASMAEPPRNGDPVLATWFRGLRAPNGTACCSIADCRRANFRQTAHGYEAMIDHRWVAVPWEQVLRRTDNPTGEAVVCYLPHTDVIMCFVRPPDI